MARPGDSSVFPNHPEDEPFASPGMTYRGLLEAMAMHAILSSASSEYGIEIGNRLPVDRVVAQVRQIADAMLAPRTP